MREKGSVRKIKKARGVICHAIFDARVIKMEGLIKNCLLWSARMWSRSATTGLIFESPFMLQETVGALSDPERGAASLAYGTATSRVTS